MTDDMGFDLKLPTVGEMTFPQWQDWLVHYNALLLKRGRRIEELEAALSHYACGCKEDKCTPEKPRYRDLKCGWPARQALEGKKND